MVIKTLLLKWSDQKKSFEELNDKTITYNENVNLSL